MNTKRGKGYFYSSGASAGNTFSRDVTCLKALLWLKHSWPEWARNAYIEGYFGRGCP